MDKIHQNLEQKIVQHQFQQKPKQKPQQLVKDDQLSVFIDKPLGQKINVPKYIQIRESDSPKLGDFVCGGTMVEDCCAFYVRHVEEAKRICNAFDKLCKGFVLSSLSVAGDKLQYLMYLKNDVSGMVSNFLTDFFVKTEYMKQMDWRIRGNQGETHNAMKTFTNMKADINEVFDN